MTDTVLRAAPQESISSLSDQTLVLRGRGTFRYLGVKLYTASFYVSPAVRTWKEMLGDVPKRIVIDYLHDIPRDAMVQAAEKNLKNNPEIDHAKIKKRLQNLHSRYAAVNKGDEHSLVYFHGKTLLYLNQKLQAEVDGEDFASAYFSIWLSKYSISQRLRNALLGVNSSRKRE